MTNREKILDISKRLGLAHIGSCLSVLPILEHIYNEKKPDDIVILDNAHAHLAHLVVKGSALFDDYTLKDQMKDWNVERLIQEHGIHCDRKAGCDVSGGSLGHGLGIGIGMAISNPLRKVYVIISDGSIMEGSNWEALRIAKDLNLTNLEVHLNANGYSAYKKIDIDDLEQKLIGFYPVRVWRTNSDFNDIKGQAAHYETLS